MKSKKPSAARLAKRLEELFSRADALMLMLCGKAKTTESEAEAEFQALNQFQQDALLKRSREVIASLNALQIDSIEKS